MSTSSVEIKENHKSLILIRKQINMQDCTSYMNTSVTIMMLVRMCWIGYIMSKCFALFHHILEFMQDLSAIYNTEIDRTCLSFMSFVYWKFIKLKRKKNPKELHVNEVYRSLIYSSIKLNMFEIPENKCTSLCMNFNVAKFTLPSRPMKKRLNYKQRPQFCFFYTNI